MEVDHKYNATVARVVDGDTIDLLIDVGFYMTAKIRVRLLDIDTPEVYGTNACPEGTEASNYVKKLLPEGLPVVVFTEKTGKYGRWLAKIWLSDDRCLNDILIQKGWSY